MPVESLPGAALEAPDSFRVRAASLWPRLLVALGYQGGARWVALYVSSDHAMYNDGSGSGSSGATGLFLAYKRHPVVARHLAGAHLGSADEEARDWLLIDQAELARLLDDAWQEEVVPADWRERVAEAIREGRANYHLMQQWLDQHE